MSELPNEPKRKTQQQTVGHADLPTHLGPLEELRYVVQDGWVKPHEDGTRTVYVQLIGGMRLAGRLPDDAVYAIAEPLKANHRSCIRPELLGALMGLPSGSYPGNAP